MGFNFCFYFAYVECVERNITLVIINSFAPVVSILSKIRNCVVKLVWWPSVKLNGANKRTASFCRFEYYQILNLNSCFQVIEVPALRAISQHMHLICLQCISSLGLGDEDYLRTLLCNVVFCIDYFRYMLFVVAP